MQILAVKSKLQMKMQELCVEWFSIHQQLYWASEEEEKHWHEHDEEITKFWLICCCTVEPVCKHGNSIRSPRLRDRDRGKIIDTTNSCVLRVSSAEQCKQKRSCIYRYAAV